MNPSWITSRRASIRTVPSPSGTATPISDRKRAGERPSVAKADPSPSVDPSKPIAEKTVNSRPFSDLATAVNAMRDSKAINLEAEFSVTAKGKLTKEGKLDEKSFKFLTAASSDPKMVDVVKQSVEAFNDSGTSARPTAQEDGCLF